MQEGLRRGGARSSRRRRIASRAATFLAFAAVAACGGGGGGGHGGGPPLASPWPGYAGDAQHSALSDAATQDLVSVRWTHAVDLAPQYTGDVLYIHYGTPIVTRANTVVIPVKTGASGGYRFDGVRGDTGASVWTMPTDYVLPPHDWVPSVSGVLTSNGRLYVPGAGGTLLWRDDPDSASSTTGRIAFYGNGTYAGDSAAFDATVFVNTPLTTDAMGNVYFGVQVTGSNPAGVTSALVRVSQSGAATWVPVTTYDAGATKVAHQAAPALSTNEQTVYALISATDGTSSSEGWLVAVRASDLDPVGKVRLLDPQSGDDAIVTDDSSASPTVGPDGDVYVGVLENPLGANHVRGWLLHFDASLATARIPAAFGWDDTAAVVPASIVPSYSGPSPYLLAIKYNDYVEAGGTGVNRLAVVDPFVSATESVTGFAAMKEVLTVAGVTPDTDFLATNPGAVREWCVNTTAVSVATKSILCNSEDGICYRWNLVTNTLDQSVPLEPPTGEAYTPTVVGPDGTVYAINNAILHAIGR